MKIVQNGQFTCAVCSKSFAADEVAAGTAVRNVIADLIRRDHPMWSTTSRICRDDLSRYSMEYLESLLQLQHGELNNLGREAVASLQKHGVFAANVESAFEQDLTIGQRLADRLVHIGSSRAFVMAFGGVLAMLLMTNAAALYWQPSNATPFILVNLVLGCIAAIQAPIIGISQIPHGAKDRLRWEHSYLMNLKAEVGIRQLNKTVDDLSAQQRQLLVELQEMLMVVMRSGKPEPARTVKAG